MSKTIVCCFVLLLCGAVLEPALAAEQQSPDVRQLMTAEEFRAAGLEKLGPEEIDALNRWVVRYTAKDAPLMRQGSEEVRAEIQKVDAEVIRSRIDGAFVGWSGKTLFKLENGQVWRQRLSGTYVWRTDHPEVEISKNFMGFYQMKMVATGKSIGVKMAN